MYSNWSHFDWLSYSIINRILHQECMFSCWKEFPILLSFGCILCITDKRHKLLNYNFTKDCNWLSLIGKVENVTNVISIRHTLLSKNSIKMWLSHAKYSDIHYRISQFNWVRYLRLRFSKAPETCTFEAVFLSYVTYSEYFRKSIRSIRGIPWRKIVCSRGWFGQSSNQFRAVPVPFFCSPLLKD